MTTAIIYTWPPDYLMAAYAVRALRALGIRPVVAIEHDAARLVIEGAEVVRTRFARGGNLNGKEFICGHLRLMQEHATGEVALKIDSDTLLLSWPEMFSQPNAVAMGIWVERMQGMQGSCYALRSSSLPEMIERADALPQGVHYLEDRTVGQLAEDCGPVHLPVYGKERTRYGTWRPEKEQTPEQYREQQDVLIFPRLGTSDPRFQRRAITDAMATFFP